MPYRGLDSGPRESGERLRFAVAFAVIVLYDYHMSIQDETREILTCEPKPPTEDEGHPAPDMTSLEVAAANPRSYQQWLDAQ